MRRGCWDKDQLQYWAHSYIHNISLAHVIVPGCRYSMCVHDEYISFQYTFKRIMTMLSMKKNYTYFSRVYQFSLFLDVSIIDHLIIFGSVFIHSLSIYLFFIYLSVIYLLICYCCKKTFYCNDLTITELGIIDSKKSSTAYAILYDTWLWDSNRRVGVWSLPWRWHILSIPLTTGRRTGAETCGLDDVFPPEDLCSRPEALC